VSAGSGLLVVDKPAGVTSHDVVARVRRLAGTRKVGHAGTLDPMATGVLLLGLEKATRLLGHLALEEKGYDATVRLGIATTTDDAQGEVLSTASAGSLDRTAVCTALEAFVGELDQVPSSVSAVKVDGRRAYARVRSGEEVVLTPRRVTIRDLAVGAVRRPEGQPGLLDVDVRLRCSSGTYVRAIARDLGAALGVGGHLTALRRTAVGPVGLAEAAPLNRLEETAQVPLVSMAEAARRFFPTVRVDADGARQVGFGRAMPADQLAGGGDLAGERPLAILGPDGAFLALYRPGDAGLLAPGAVFV